jgi:hypothetical protein
LISWAIEGDTAIAVGWVRGDLYWELWVEFSSGSEQSGAERALLISPSQSLAGTPYGSGKHIMSGRGSRGLEMGKDRSPVQVVGNVKPIDILVLHLNIHTL